MPTTKKKPQRTQLPSLSLAPTGPSATPSKPKPPSAPSVRRTQLILKNGGKWLPPQTIWALADSKMPEDQLIATVGAIRQSVVKGLKSKGINPDDGFKYLYDDPVLEKRSSAALALKRYLSGALGPWPIQDEDLHHIQRNLQGQGFGADLKVSGAWDAQWDAAYREWTHKLVMGQLSGKQPGAAPFTTALHWLGAVLPKEAGNAIIGFAKSLPGSARQLAADVASAAGGPAGSRSSAVAGGFVMGQNPQEFQSDVEGRPVTGFEGGFTGHPTYGADDPGKQYGHIVGRTADDIGTMLMLHSSMKVGARLGVSIGEGLLKQGAGDLALAEAQQAGGVAGRTLSFRGALGGVADTAVGTPALRQPGAIAGALGRAAESRAVQNVPGLARVGAGIGRLADAEGAYYKYRTLAASPYRFKAVAVAGEAISEGGVLGAKLRAGGAITHALGGDNLSQIQDEHVLDHVDDAIQNRLDFTVLGQHVTPHLDDIAWFLHGPTSGGKAASNRFGDDVDTAVQAVTDTLGEVGIETQAHRATGLATQDMVKALGGRKRYAQFIGHKWNEYAAAFYAENKVNREAALVDGPPQTFLERRQKMWDLEHEAWLDPEIMAQARRDLLGMGDEQFALRMREEITHSRLSPKGWLEGNGSKFLDASEIITKKIGPYEAPEAFINGATREEQAAGARIGLARLDTLTKGEANTIVTGFEQRGADMDVRLRAARKARRVISEGGVIEEAELQAILDATPTLDEFMKLEEDIGDHLFLHHGVRAEFMPHDVDGKIDRARNFANGLASEVFPARENEVSAITDAFDELRGLGYKPVYGRDIGWMHARGTPLDVFDGDIKFRRKIIEHIGMNPQRYSSLHIGAYRRIGIKSAIQDLVDAGTVRLPRWWTTDTIWAYLKKEGVLDQPPTGLAGRATRVPKKAVFALAEEQGITKVQAEAQLRAEIAGALQLRDIGRKHAIDVLTDSGGFERYTEESRNIALREKQAGELTGDLDELKVAPFTRREAELVYRAIVKGSAAPKAYMLGLSRMDDLFRSSMGFMGAASVRRGPGDLTAAEKAAFGLANLPNALVQARNRFRFELSPWFSFRRMAKTNVKLGLEGVAPTLRPLDAMERAGTLAEDRNVLRRVYPHLHNDVSDAADRYLRDNDVFGFYNSRNYEAYAAGTWSRQGKGDDEIHRLINKTFTYGTREGEGRSALERSANFVFFPFSFEKTLYRNLGGFLLDRPGQLMLLTRGLAAYNEFNANHMDGKNPLAASWWEKHVPMLEEVERLNAFSHGLSPGEFGGINRPLVNVFLPQSWSSSKDNLALLKRFVPAVKDLGRIIDESKEQGVILYGALDGLRRKVSGDKATFVDPAATTLSRDAQLEEAYALQRELYERADLTPALRYNAHHAKSRYKFGDDWGDFAGEDVSKENLKKIIHRRYPAYDPNKATIRAILGESGVKDYLRDVKNTPDGKIAAELVDLSEKWGRAFDDDRVTADQMAQATADLRHAAARLSRRDSTFYDLYQRHLKRVLGPLEAVK